MVPAGTRRRGASRTPSLTASSPPAYWVDLAQQAERGLLDFVTIEDSLDLQSDDHFRP